MKSITIKPDGTMTVNSAKLTLEFLQGEVGGYIEPVGFNGGEAYCNEEGLINGLELNPLGTMILRQLGAYAPGICGPIVLVGPVDSEGRETALPEHIARYVLSAKA